jgi:O-methyltransferase
MRTRATALSPKKRFVSRLLRSHSTFIDRLNRVALFSEFVRKYNDVPIFEERTALYAHINALLGAGPIDYLEFGVHEGASIREWTHLNRSPESRFVGFDSFEGLPQAWDYLEAGAFSTGGKVPNIDDARATFVRGWFQDTLGQFLDGFVARSRLVVNNDSDLYSSTLFMLTKLDALLIPGTIVFFDEFDDVQHEFRAMVDYADAYRRDFVLLGATDRYRTAAFEVR